MIANTAGVILAGGKSSRFGSNKAMAMVAGKPMICHVVDIIEPLFAEHLLVTNIPEKYSFIGWDTGQDIYPGAGPLAGIHAALTKVKSEKIFVVGCDMPFLRPEVIRFICDQHKDSDVVIPETKHGLEPLHALYHKTCLAQASADLQVGQRRLHFFLKQLKTTVIPWLNIAAIDPELTSFRNINQQKDLQTSIPKKIKA